VSRHITLSAEYHHHLTLPIPAPMLLAVSAMAALNNQGKNSTSAMQQLAQSLFGE
jgi:hypothetical protein